MILAAYIDATIRHARVIVVVCVVLSVVAAVGVTRLSITNDMRAYFSADNPQLQAFNALEEKFDKQDNLQLILIAGPTGVFSPQGLALVRTLTELAWQLPYSYRVDSLSNFAHISAAGDDISIADLVPQTGEIDAQRAAEIEDIALSSPDLVNRLVAADGSAAIVLVTLSLPEGDIAANDEVVRVTRERLAAVHAANPDSRILLSGTAATHVSLGEAVARDLRSLVAISFAAVLFGLLILLRHLVGTLSVAALAGLVVVMTMGLAGWAGTTLEAVSGFVPSVVMTVAVADSIHLLSTYYYELRRGRSREQAIRQAVLVNFKPILITSLTTMAGVLSLNLSDSPPYHDLGNLIALGVFIAFLLSLSFLPALLALVPVRAPQRGARFEAFMSAFADRVIRHRKSLLIGMIAFCLFLASFIPRNELSERWYEYFDDSFEIRQSFDAIERHFDGFHLVRYGVSSGSPDGVNSPVFLREVDRFVQWLRSDPEVASVSALTDTLKRLNKSLHGDDPSWNRLPDSAELCAQLLLLYELSLPMGLGLETTLSIDRESTQLLVLVPKRDSEQLIALDERFRAWANENLETAELLPGASVDMMFAHINRRNTRSLLTGMVAALAVISVLLVFALRSLRLGALSLLTNLAPAGVAYGIWGLSVARIDLSASTVICLSIGIVVDDTVHFLSKYLWARRNEGLSPADALRYAFNTVGVALCVTTVVLVAGFLVLSASHFSPTVTTGLLMSITLSFALAVDFLLLPPLLLALDNNELDNNGQVPR